MEAQSPNEEIAGPFTCAWQWLMAIPGNIWTKGVEAAREAKRLGKDDPRRIIHSLKVAIAVTFVSLFYYFKPLYDDFGVTAIWAVLSVVFVFEFSVGATLGRGINRMLATLLAGVLGVGAHCLANLCGKIGEPILLGIFVFIVAAVVTFMRFLPRLQLRYDFGLFVFILTFCLISVSSYREDALRDMAQKRLLTIIIGSCGAIIVSICICPIWIGEDLHNLVAVNIKKLGNFLEGFGDEYFKASEDGQSNNDKSFLQGYKKVLTSKNIEETMAALAAWEPRHGRFRFRHPWKQYLKVGNITRECAYKIEALNSYLNYDIQTPLVFRSRIQDLCTMMSSESGKALKELASALHKMVCTTSVIDSHIENAKIAAENLKSQLNTSLWEDAGLLEIIPAAAVASLLLDIVSCTQKIAEAVNELASLAHFKSPQEANLLHRGTVQSMSSVDVQNHIISLGQ